eukprot:UN12218
MNMAHSNHGQNIPQVTALSQLVHVCKPCNEIVQNGIGFNGLYIYNSKGNWKLFPYSKGKLFKRELDCTYIIVFI